MDEVFKPAKLKIYINPEKKTAEEVKAEEGCDYAINLALFETETYKPVGNLKADGVVICQQWGADKGFFWSGNEPLQFDWTDMKSADNFFSCVRMIEDGKPIVPLEYNKEMGGERQRTAFGVTEDGRIWMYADTKNQMTPEELQAFAATKGLKHALMMDGGLSTQGAGPNGTVKGGRPAYSLLCAWAEEDNSEDKGGSSLNIQEPKYNWKYNPGTRGKGTYLVMHHAAAEICTAESIHNYHLSKGWAGIAYHYFVRKNGSIYRGRPEDWKGGHTSNRPNELGICFEGNFEEEEMPKAQLVAGKALVADILKRHPHLQMAAHKDLGSTSCPGRFFPYAEFAQNVTKPTQTGGEKTVTVTLTQLAKGAQGASVKSLQQLLTAKGYDTKGADGIFGANTQSALRAYQKAMGLTADGICGQNSWTALLTR